MPNSIGSCAQEILNACVQNRISKQRGESDGEAEAHFREFLEAGEWEQAGVKHGSSRRKHWYALGERLPVWVKETKESYLT